MNIGKLVLEIEADIEHIATPEAQAAAAVEHGVGVIPMRRIRSNFYEPIPLPGAAWHDPWALAARTRKQARKNFAKAEADAVGVAMPNGDLFVIDSASRNLVRFTRLVDLGRK